MTRAIGWHHWTEADIALIFKLHDDQHLSWILISERIPGTTAKTCSANYWNLARSLKRRRTPYVPPLLCPPTVLADLEGRNVAKQARAEASERSGNMTAVLFGDPPRGYSALDQRKVSA